MGVGLAMDKVVIVIVVVAVGVGVAVIMALAGEGVGAVVVVVEVVVVVVVATLISSRRCSPLVRRAGGGDNFCSRFSKRSSSSSSLISGTTTNTCNGVCCYSSNRVRQGGCLPLRWVFLGPAGCQAMMTGHLSHPSSLQNFSSALQASSAASAAIRTVKGVQSPVHSRKHQPVSTKPPCCRLHSKTKACPTPSPNAVDMCG